MSLTLLWDVPLNDSCYLSIDNCRRYARLRRAISCQLIIPRAEGEQSLGIDNYQLPIFN